MNTIQKNGIVKQTIKDSLKNKTKIKTAIPEQNPVSLFYHFIL